MKKFFKFRIFVILCALAWVSSCQKSDIDVQVHKPDRILPFTVSQEQAKELASHFVAAPQNQNEKSNARVSSVMEITKQETILDNNSNEPLLYIMNRKKGSVVVSADFRTMPVLAYSEDSQFNTENMPEV